MPEILDKDNIRDQIQAFPQQIIKGLKVEFDFEPLKVPADSNYVICGMGGSSQIYDLLQNILESVGESVHIYVSRSYTLPRETNDKSAVVVISYSGNTEETLSCYDEAKEKGMPLVAMASGGSLKEKADADGTPFVAIPTEGISQPRYSVGYQLAFHLKLLEAHGLIQNHDEEFVAACEEAASFNYEDNGKELAARLDGKIPVLYAASEYNAVIRMGTIKFGENSKILSHWNELPEMNHNEMNGFVYAPNQGQFYVLMLRAADNHERVTKRFEVLASLIKDKGIEVEEFDMEGSSRLARIISGLNYIDWASFYVAQQNGVDPSPVDMVEDFKKKLG
ncbi:SIS domain-containing protein [Patescibacteria group bacterium]